MIIFLGIKVSIIIQLHDVLVKYNLLEFWVTTLNTKNILFNFINSIYRTVPFTVHFYNYCRMNSYFG